jgi:ADP-heptose:LPS heptosyltransferase
VAVTLPAEPDDRPQLLVLRALGLGDLLTAVPALRALATAFADHRRVLACPAALAPLVTRIGGFDVVDARGLAALPPAGPVSVAVNLHGRGPQSHRRLLAVGPRHLVAFRHPAIATTAGAPRWSPGEHEVARWCRMLAGHGIPADPGNLDLHLDVDLGLDAPRPDVGRVPPLTVVHPGAASEARRWPAARFAAVARREVADGHRVVVTGAAAERELGERVAALAGLPAAAVLAGRTSLADLVAVVRRAETVVCGDTGVAHLATALGRPSVVLFGPTSPAEWGPPRDRPWHRVLWAGRTGDPHGALVDPGLLEISVADVCRELRALRRDQPWRPPALSGGAGARPPRPRAPAAARSAPARGERRACRTWR